MAADRQQSALKSYQPTNASGEQQQQPRPPCTLTTCSTSTSSSWPAASYFCVMLTSFSTVCHPTYNPRLSNALREVMKDFVDRMREIKAKLEGKEGEPDAASLQEKEQMMDELMEIVENVDYARGEQAIRVAALPQG